MKTWFIIFIFLGLVVPAFAVEPPQPIDRGVKQQYQDSTVSGRNAEWVRMIKKYADDEKAVYSERQKEILRNMEQTVDSDKVLGRICYEFRDLLYDYKLTQESVNNPDSTYIGLERISKSICAAADREEQAKRKKR